MKVKASGWLSGVHYIYSPNYDGRPAGTSISLLVIHNISLPPGIFNGDAIIRFFTNVLPSDEHPYYAQLRDLKVSSHFLVRRDGEIIQFVSCNKRAWHAGVSVWHGRDRCNDYSIGIELEGTDDAQFTASQYDALAKLGRRICRTYPIKSIVGHSDIAPQRKTDPGPNFEWQRFYAQLRR